MKATLSSLGYCIEISETPGYILLSRDEALELLDQLSGLIAQMPSTPPPPYGIPQPPRDCIHGHQARKCLICELESIHLAKIGVQDEQPKEQK